MSDLRVNTISASDGTSPVTLTKQEAIKAWASFDQHSTDHPIYSNSSLNTASTLDVGAGVTKISFTNSFSNATYGVSGCTQAQDTSGTIFTIWGYSTTSSRQMTTSDFHTDFRSSAGSGTDSDYVAYNVLGDLA
jgi:hypothetical protein